MTESVACTTEGVGAATSRANALRAAAVVGFFVLVSAGTFIADARYLYFSAYLWFGFIYGASLQYGRFCMASAVRDLFLDRSAWQAWADAYRQRLQLEHSVDEARSTAMRAVNPKYILRNHLAEIAIRRARENDFSEVARLRQLLSRPFDEQPDMAHYAALPPDWAGGLEVSCSS